ncbi:MAG: hypothetical protein FXF47_05085, partial [Candidatus Mcinerneyibacterium aminivorans]
MKKFFLILLLAIFVFTINADIRDKIYRKYTYNYGGIAGYNPKEPFYKFSGYWISESGFGIELSYVTNTRWKNNDSDYYSNLPQTIVEEDFGDRKLRTETGKSLYIANGIFRITKRVYIFTGPVYGHSERYAEYEDSTDYLITDGTYWIRDGDSSKGWFC